jgi:adenosylcobinamide-GDP ribazoletransferase
MRVIPSIKARIQWHHTAFSKTKAIGSRSEEVAASAGGLCIHDNWLQMQFIRHYLLAIQFFTRIPVTGRLAAWVGYSPEMLRASAAHFPGVGVLVGGLVAGLSMLLMAVLSKNGQYPTLLALVIAVLGTVFSVMLTGAFHEDGLADVADGLGGSQNRERALEIMKDSRVGAFGAIALVLILLSKVSLLAMIGDTNPLVMLFGIFLAHVVSRTFALLLIRLLPHVGDIGSSKSKPLADQISLKSIFFAFLWLFLAIASVFIAYAAIEMIALTEVIKIFLTAFVVAVGAFVYMWRMFAKRLQGFTGDCLGATQQVCEVAFYLGLAIALGWAGS